MAGARAITLLTLLAAYIFGEGVVRADDSGSPYPTWAPDILKNLPHTPDQPTSLYGAAIPEHSNVSPLPQQYLDGDPLLDPQGMPQPGFYAGLDVEAVGPHVFKSIAGDVTAGSRPSDFVSLTNRGLDWTVAPTLELGYRLPDGIGGFSISYRAMSTSGDSNVFTSENLQAPLHSRFDMNVVDFDYLSREFTPWELCTMSWRLGGRAAYMYYDAVLSEAPGESPSGILQQKVTNKFAGFGPHITLEMERNLPTEGLSILGRMDYSSIFGHIDQGAYETALDPKSPTGVSWGQTVVGGTQTLPTISMLLGLDWRPAGWANVDMFLGYQYEYWWNVGRFSQSMTSRGELSLQGVVFHLRYNY